MPAPLKPLLDLAYNFWWTWAAPPDGTSVASVSSAADIFAWVSPRLWERTNHNPIRVLLEAGDVRLQELAADPAFVGAAAAAWRQLETHVTSSRWWHEQPGIPRGEGAAGGGKPFLAAYFCAEYGLAECFQIYSGGLGLLAGDHLKSASGLGIPLVGVGLLYRCGFFHQSLDGDGMQVERSPEMPFERHPVRRVMGPGGGEVIVHVRLPGREVAIGVWRSDVGRVPLYLLDTDLPQNTEQDREITRSLYLGDHDMRIRQEIVLGIGGVRALAALGLEPTVCHMNEGHAGFMSLERTRMARERSGGTFDQVREATAAGHVFTTHTPVPAGIDRFSPSLVSHYFGSYHDSLGLDMEGLLALGRENVADQSESFSMAVLAIRMSRFANGVSRLHGRVSRGMWRNIWPGTPRDDIPIGHVTNGVHASGWVGPRVAEMLDRHVGRGWRETPQDSRSWERLSGVEDSELWRVRSASRMDLVSFCRQRVRSQLQSRGAGELELGVAARVLSPELLTIGFARRFAAYKRGTLLLRDPERLLRLLRAERGVQVVISGKAHPGDTGGKRLIQDIIRFARASKVEDRVVFIEDYDIEVARQLVRGCDAWLNTPIRGLEASGTSGMKAAMNGVINVSTLDGWWDEGFASDLGFHVESVGTFDDDTPNAQREQFESDALYRLLEHQLIPEFYERDSAGVPRGWTGRMRRCMQQLAPRFNTHRMVMEYAERYYVPAHQASMRLEAGNLQPARSLSDHIDRLRSHWRRVHVNDVQSEPGRGRPIMDVSAVVELDGLGPEDVLVQLSHGQLDSHGELQHVRSLEMQHDRDMRDGSHRFVIRFEPTRSPREAWVVRVLPRHKFQIHPFVPGLIASSTLQRLESHAGAPGGGERGPRA
ncbi:MAG: alpha-glucan family phosphorylase [Phycisphaerales bacterium]